MLMSKNLSLSEFFFGSPAVEIIDFCCEKLLLRALFGVLT